MVNRPHGERRDITPRTTDALVAENLEGRAVIFEFKAPTHPWSINQERRKHWGWRAAKAKLWREAAFYAWKQQRPKDWEQRPCVVEVVLPVRDSRRRDPHNYGGAVKALVDGLVDAGVWPDDTPEWVTVNEAELVVRRSGLVSVRLTER